jgi:hypothetical protein
MLFQVPKQANKHDRQSIKKVDHVFDGINIDYMIIGSILQGYNID